MAKSKWILGGLGFVIGGPIGALIGALIGSAFDNACDACNTNDASQEQANNNSQRHSQHRRSSTTQGDISVSIIVLLACVIKADGRVLKSEISFVKPFLVKTFGEAGAKQSLHLLKQLLQQDINPTAVAQQIRQHVNYSIRLELVHLLLQVAQSDNEVADSECRIIEIISVNMGISDADYQSLLSPYRKQKNTNWAYNALEIQPSATDEEVKKAYRRMAMKYHPDKVATAGDNIRQQATEKFRMINEAYEHIKSLRSLK